MPVILQSNLAAYIEQTLRQINDGVKAARDSGITGALMPEEVDFTVVVVTEINAFPTSQSTSDPVSQEVAIESGTDGKTEVLVATDVGGSTEESTGTDTRNLTTTQTENGTESGTSGRTTTSTAAGSSTDNTTSTDTPGVETRSQETIPAGQRTTMEEAGGNTDNTTNTYDTP